MLILAHLLFLPAKPWLALYNPASLIVNPV